jgi:hypothetical protein
MDESYITSINDESNEYLYDKEFKLKNISNAKVSFDEFISNNSETIEIIKLQPFFITSEFILPNELNKALSDLDKIKSKIDLLLFNFHNFTFDNINSDEFNNKFIYLNHIYTDDNNKNYIKFNIISYIIIKYWTDYYLKSNNNFPNKVDFCYFIIHKYFLLTSIFKINHNFNNKFVNNILNMLIKNFSLFDILNSCKISELFLLTYF